MLFSLLADRFVLRPSRDQIDIPHKQRREVSCAGMRVEVWTERSPAASAPEELREPELFVLKFNGMGGRAERTTVHPLEVWPDLPGEVWSANPPGYGGSEGRASLKSLAAVARSVFEELLAVAGSRPIIVAGNSLGTTSALHVAAHFANVPNLVGLVLRNPPPLPELIRGRYAWRTFGLAHGVAKRIPPELDSVANAARVRLPCVIQQAGRDRIVPPRYQQLIVEAYAGPKQVVTVPAADHAFVLAPEDAGPYVQALSWLRSHSGLAEPNPFPLDSPAIS
ncbi:MAG TPA: alpha/beta fold hydrolase [Pirellulaceae bacterium]|nr:alpha/beta fold hydrolase [Pirellulaceae bacterium]